MPRFTFLMRRSNGGAHLFQDNEPPPVILKQVQDDEGKISLFTYTRHPEPSSA